MKQALINLLLFFLSSISAAAQAGFKLSYEQLKSYEGTYAFDNPPSLQFAASPKDGLLYAIIASSKYPLRPFQKDIFLNNGNQEVQFIRDGKGSITGYRIKNGKPEKFYPLISRQVSFTSEMWFAKGDGKTPYHWIYHIPQDLQDGLQVGPLLSSGLDTGLIRQMIERVIDGTYKDVNSILLIKDGKLVLEEYFYGFNVDSLHELRSATKSFTSALVGIAIDKGVIKGTDEHLASLFTEYTLGDDARKQAITIGDLLTQRSGFACNDDDQNSPGNETKIYPTGDWLKTILALPMAGDPGKQASYCSGNALLLDRIVEKASGLKLHDFAKHNLFTPLGIRKFQWEFIPDSTHQEDFGQLRLRPRDMSKFGLMYLNGGKWGNKQVVSENFVAASLHNYTNLRDLGYGYLWWCEDLQSNGKVFKGFAAKGNGGQRIFLWPDQHLIAVITAGNYNSHSPANQMLIECVLAGLR